MAILGPNPWVNPFGKMSIFRLFELLFFIAQKGVFSLQNTIKDFFLAYIILGDPGADKGGEGKSKRAEKYDRKKSKDRREEPLGTMSYQTSSKRSPPFWLLIGARKLVFFWHQSKARTAATVGTCLLYTSPSPRDGLLSRMPSSA